MDKKAASRKGGLIGGSKITAKTKNRGFGSMTPEQRQMISAKAHQARWGKKNG